MTSWNFLQDNGDVANISLYEVLINNRMKYNDYECVIKLLKVQM